MLRRPDEETRVAVEETGGMRGPRNEAGVGGKVNAILEAAEAAAEEISAGRPSGGARDRAARGEAGGLADRGAHARGGAGARRG